MISHRIIDSKYWSFAVNTVQHSTTDITRIDNSIFKLYNNIMKEIKTSIYQTQIFVFENVPICFENLHFAKDVFIMLNFGKY